MKTGTAHLPLHYGSAPAWLFEKMTRLAREITQVIIAEQGVGEYLTKLSNPAWFQAFGCVLGFDWHSSGLTTTTCGALKVGLKPIQKDLGLFVCGGKGSASRKTPDEIESHTQSLNHLITQSLVYSSRMAAKVDNNALQDGYQLYHHTFIFTKDGQWAVIQQGMNPKNRSARRYHWLSDNVTDFVCEPHSGIASEDNPPIGGQANNIVNMVARDSIQARTTVAKLAKVKPEKTLKSLKKLKSLTLTPRHQILLSDINPENLKKIFLSTYERKPENFETLLGLPGVGPKSIRALALISELIYQAPYCIHDPATYSFAHGGKDGTPYPVDRKNYDQSILSLHDVVKKARLGHYERLHSLRRLASLW